MRQVFNKLSSLSAHLSGFLSTEGVLLGACRHLEGEKHKERKELQVKVIAPCPLRFTEPSVLCFLRRDHSFLYLCLAIIFSLGMSSYKSSLIPSTELILLSSHCLLLCQPLQAPRGQGQCFIHLHTRRACLAEFLRHVVDPL